jgi:hypothetical protein
MVTNPEGKDGRESITSFLTTLTVDYDITSYEMGGFNAG